jgi:hypothetical protein
MVFCFLVACGCVHAAEIGVGATRGEVIAALGEPLGTSSTGEREVLSYAAGRVFLREGKVEEMEFKVKPAAVETVAPKVETSPPPAPAQAPSPARAPAPAEAKVERRAPNWLKFGCAAVLLLGAYLLGRHWAREAKLAQEMKNRDLLSR